MWSVSGLMGIHRFERVLRHAAKQNIFFFSLTSKNFLIILHFQYFFINLQLLTASEPYRLMPSDERRVLSL